MSPMLTQILGQPCEFQVKEATVAARAEKRARRARWCHDCAKAYPGELRATLSSCATVCCRRSDFLYK
jgi:hypothetical protein